MAKLAITKVADVAALAASANYGFKADYHRVRSVSAVWTATTAAFTLGLQYSNDNTNWHDFAAATAITNANGTVMWDVVNTKDALYWRVAAVRTSGTLTTLQAYVAYEER